MQLRCVYTCKAEKNSSQMMECPQLKMGKREGIIAQQTAAFFLSFFASNQRETDTWNDGQQHGLFPEVLYSLKYSYSEKRGAEVCTWIWRNRAIILFVLIETNLLFALWPTVQQDFSLLLLARLALGSLAWWYAWKKVWRKAILQIHVRQNNKS